MDVSPNLPTPDKPQSPPPPSDPPSLPPEGHRAPFTRPIPPAPKPGASHGTPAFVRPPKRHTPLAAAPAETPLAAEPAAPEDLADPDGSPLSALGALALPPYAEAAGEPDESGGQPDEQPADPPEEHGSNDDNQLKFRIPRPRPSADDVLPEPAAGGDGPVDNDPPGNPPAGAPPAGESGDGDGEEPDDPDLQAISDALRRLGAQAREQGEDQLKRILKELGLQHQDEPPAEGEPAAEAPDEPESAEPPEVGKNILRNPGAIPPRKLQGPPSWKDLVDTGGTGDSTEGLYHPRPLEEDTVELPILGQSGETVDASLLEPGRGRTFWDFQERPDPSDPAKQENPERQFRPGLKEGGHMLVVGIMEILDERQPIPNANEPGPAEVTAMWYVQHDDGPIKVTVHEILDPKMAEAAGHTHSLVVMKVGKDNSWERASDYRVAKDGIARRTDSVPRLTQEARDELARSMYISTEDLNNMTPDERQRWMTNYREKVEEQLAKARKAGLLAENMPVGPREVKGLLTGLGRQVL